LTVLLEREQGTRDSAALALQRAEQQLDRANSQAEQLAQYRTEYIARWAAHFNRQAAMEIVHCYRSFMQRLEQAIAMQARQAALAEQQQAQARHALLECERRLASVRKLIERRGAELAQAGRRREQKHTDEQAQRMRWSHTQRDRLLPQ